MSRFALSLFVCLLPACSLGPVGPAGSDGAAGPQGAPGVDGKDAFQAGSRLIPRCIHGKDGSRQCVDWHDTDRDEVCSFREEDGALLCLPPIVHATEWNTFVDPDCSGDYGFVALFAPAHFPAGTSLARMLEGPLAGELLMRGEEVPELYTNGSGLPCQPLVPSPGFAPPYHHWPLFDPSAFVAGTVE
jgi:hypothetical protein